MNFDRPSVSDNRTLLKIIRDAKPVFDAQKAIWKSRSARTFGQQIDRLQQVVGVHRFAESHIRPEIP